MSAKIDVWKDGWVKGTHLVWMILQGKFSISFLELIVSCGLVDTQELVVVFPHVGMESIWTLLLLLWLVLGAMIERGFLFERE